MVKPDIGNDLVRYSRAGDEFHYRWAARRCLKLIYPNSCLDAVTIEGSRENKRAGEYVIDVAEYYRLDDGSQGKAIYFQLKHSSVRAEKLFNLSELKGTIEGFADRYKDILGSPQPDADVRFCIVSNRSFGSEFKNGLTAILNDECPTIRFGNTIEKYTGLFGPQLKSFCECLELVDGESDYHDQRYELQLQVAQLVAGGASDSYIDSIIALVREHALPGKKGQSIVCEDVLKRFGVTSRRELFPAPPVLEEISSPIIRQQHDDLLEQIVDSSTPVVIHASGGIGKSVTARQLAGSLPNGSLGVIFDCFAAGEYRNPSVPRHRHRDALVQIANEIAANGYCDPLLLSPSLHDNAVLLRAFLARLSQAHEALKETHDDAILAIFIDAADNAEMAAKEAGDRCFANELLKVAVPVGCRIIELCRSERRHLLNPDQDVLQIELEPFSEAETLSHLRMCFSDATQFDGLELWRLSGGNPRVQANALNVGYLSPSELLSSLGPEGTTVGDQIAAQLDKAVAKVRGSFPDGYQGDVDSICHGLAILPPYVPIDVLAAAAEVSRESVKSFVADLGHPFIHSENFVQFRDEPTETWFRDEFASTNKQSYVSRLKPLANEYSYVAQVLPSLLLDSGDYEELIELALSNEHLPASNPVDARNVKVYRLQFAFKAALKRGCYKDAVKLAFLAGEEVAGDVRQLELLAKNVDLINAFQPQERVQEVAFRRLLQGAWQGSENVYSASILSSVEDFKGEARAYLRSAENWLHQYFDERKKNEERDPHHRDQLQTDDIVELLTSHYNLFGSKRAVDYLLSWSPSSVIYQVSSVFVRRLVDAGEFEQVDAFALHGKSHPHLIVAVANQLIKVGRFPPTPALKSCLDLLCHKRTRIIAKKSNWENNGRECYAVVSFLEACVHAGLSRQKISRVLRHYAPQIDFHAIDEDFPPGDRELFLRYIACRTILDGNLNPEIPAMMPKNHWKQSEYERKEDAKKFTQIVGGLFPWYLLRIQAIERNVSELGNEIHVVEQASLKARSGRYERFDSLPFEISSVHSSILSFASNASPDDIKSSISQLLGGESKFRLSDQLIATRAAFRVPHLSTIRSELELSCRKEISISSHEEHVESTADSYIELARAVFSVSLEDAACYFNDAIEAVSKFGDEVIERWGSVMAVATRTSEGDDVSPEVAYRFMRCAELIGNYIDREKNFDRDEVIRICSRLHLPSVFTGLSRWRDRDIGRLYRQIPALANEIVTSKALSPLAAWSLSAFNWEYELVGFAETCMNHAEDANHRQFVFDSAVHDLQLYDSSESAWKRLESISQKYSLERGKLSRVLQYLANGGVLQHDVDNSRRRSSFQYVKEPSGIDWGGLLAGLCLSNPVDLSTAISRFDTLDGPKYFEEFWPEIFNRVSEGEVLKFLQSLAEAELADLYDVESALSYTPEGWAQKVSVQRAWPSLLRFIGQRYSSELTNAYRRKNFLEGIKLKSGNDQAILHEAIVLGLSSSNDLASASMFFNFIEMISPTVTTDEAEELLEFALQRFELHIDDSFSEGPWDVWLSPPDNVTDAFTGFIWAALASPRSETRWEAAHSVRRLAEAGCINEIDSLIGWACNGCADAFVGRLLPLYDMHARLYLLMALARIAIDSPEVIEKHSALFAGYALNSKHVLIQKYAAEVAKSIEDAIPGTYDQEEMRQIRNVNVSPFPVRETECYHRENINSPWHERGEVDQSLKLHFGYDFDRYWFTSIQHIFGISVQQFEELAREVAINEWGVVAEDKFIRDPRQQIYREREIWHSHSEHPKTDDYKFYISYHVMFAVAAKLLQEMPVLQNRGGHEDEWNEWLQSHSLTSVSGGRWLADRRDPCPLLRRAWVNEEKSENWQWEIMADDFLDGLFYERDGKTWLNVFGLWNDHERERNEQIHITSALVSPDASLPLLHALNTYERCHDYKLPDYREDDFEFGCSPFELEGWIVDQYVEKGLDRFDPFAANISYPPYQVGDRIKKHFNLDVDVENRCWYIPPSSDPSLICEIWSDEVLDDRDSLSRNGRRISASLDFMQQLSKEFEREIIIEVQIERRMHDWAGRRNNDEYEYSEPYCKLFLLSQDGKLRDTTTCYQLRKDVDSGAGE